MTRESINNGIENERKDESRKWRQSRQKLSFGFKKNGEERCRSSIKLRHGGNGKKWSVMKMVGIKI